MKLKKLPFLIVFGVLSLFVLFLLVAQQNLNVGRPNSTVEGSKKKATDTQGTGVLSKVISLGKSEMSKIVASEQETNLMGVNTARDRGQQQISDVSAHEKDVSLNFTQEEVKVKKSEQTNKLNSQKDVKERGWEDIILNAKSSVAPESLYSVQKYKPGVELELLSWKMISGKTAENVIIGIDLKIMNQTVHNLKDFQIDCLSVGNSGSIIGRHTDVLYETLSAQEQKSFLGVFRIGPVNYQTSKLLCSVIWYEFV